MALEVGLAVGGAVLNAFLAVAFDRIASSRKFIKFFRRENVIKLDEKTLDRLETTLDLISEVIKDAEDKQGKSTAIRRWLGKLKHSVNHAEDLLDEFNTELLRLKLGYEFQHKQTEADMKLALNPAFVQELMPNLENVTARLEDFEKQIQRLGLQKLDPEEKCPYVSPSSPVVDESRIFGRDDEKEKMIERVLSGGEGGSDVSVIAITGMGGIGKTTLAQLVYNDDRVKEKFSSRAWACVSEKYDALRVTRTLLREVNSDALHDKDDLSSLKEKLKGNLAGKCFLIILDDMWNENYIDWDSLKNPLNYGSRGSKIIVTTRNEKIARTMQTERFHNMQPIPEDQSWSLFKSHAFGNGDHASLQGSETIAKEIVKKCKGLPLAIKTVAGALRPKEDIDEWQDFLSSELWVAGGDILPALRLSYKHLPYNLKRCFAFCALFPKDVPFDKDEVVLLWMASDLVKPSTQKVGRDWFEELKSRSFFESVKEKKYLMHDLINDLARSVNGNTCIRLEDYKAADMHQSLQQENELPPELLHFSYLSTRNETSERFGQVAEAQGLRTFLPIHQYQFSGRNLTSTFFSDILSRFQRLRTLNLSQYRISVVPDSIGDLKHLRFLNLAYTDITKLPNTIGNCLNLQTLILKNCKKLVRLPEEMRFLINLQHLDVRGLGDQFIRKMATWLSIFKDRHNISVVVDRIQLIELELLVQLQLCHSLDIIGLGDTDVVTIEKAKTAGIIDKDYIESLSLEWSGIATCSQDELNKFAKLQPHTSTKHLSIKGYNGTSFPEWLGDSVFSNMESLSLEDCKICFSLPPLGQLTGLKRLKISGMDGISEIGKEFYGDASTSKPFQALEHLEISYCNNILSFPEGGLAAPNLKRLDVCKCKKMKSLPARMDTQLPMLKLLIIVYCPEIKCFPEGALPSSLETLYISLCPKLAGCIEREKGEDWPKVSHIPEIKIQN